MNKQMVQILGGEKKLMPIVFINNRSEPISWSILPSSITKSQGGLVVVHFVKLNDGRIPSRHLI